MLSQRMRFLGGVLSLISLYVPHAVVYGQRRVSEESIIFQELKGSVFRVYGDESQGSGFLVDSCGLILTNEHVVSGASFPRVGVDDSTIVPAIVILEDRTRDFAVLRIHPDYIRQTVPIIMRADTVDLAMEGEKVLAIGYPLHQARIVTSGIVSKVEPDVIISDVNINHGNSGGPLINLDKEAIGIATFGDFTSQGGPGVSGILRIDKCFILIDSSRNLIASLPLPSLKRFPVMPRTQYPMEVLKQLPTDKKFNAKPYQMSKKGFNIEVQTPPLSYWQDRQYEERLAKDRKKREKKGNVDERETLKSRNSPKDWFKYVGEDYPAVVVINVVPKVGEKKSSIWGNILGGALAPGSYQKHTMEFKADLKNMVLLRNDEPVDEILRGLTFVPLDFFAATWGGAYQGSDIAKAGTFVFPYELFRPDGNAFAEFKMIVTKVDKPDRPDTLVIPTATVQKVWEDFAPLN